MREEFAEQAANRYYGEVDMTTSNRTIPYTAPSEPARRHIGVVTSPVLPGLRAGSFCAENGTDMKTCYTCKKPRPISDFAFHPDTRDGLQSNCRACCLVRTREHQIHQRQKVRERHRRYYLAHKERFIQQALARLRTPKGRAMQRVHDAIRAGKIVKPAQCADCGSPRPLRELHGHHEDYSLPLVVIWVCPKCHGRRHRRYDEQGHLIVPRLEAWNG